MKTNFKYFAIITLFYCIIPNFILARTIDVNSAVVLEEVIKNAVGGDTIFLHGRIILNSPIEIECSGTEARPIVITSVEGESRPVIDGNSTTVRNLIIKGNYLKFYGIEIVNSADNGIWVDGGSYCVFENLIIHHNAESGMWLSNNASYNIIKNCDSYDNIDDDQEDADGFAPKLTVGTGNYFYGCRAWENADDGYDGYMRGADRTIVTYYDHCIAYRNGYVNNSNGRGDGTGFKLGGWDEGNPRAHNAVVTNCLAALNLHSGFNRNKNIGDMRIFNCSAYNNGVASGDRNFYFGGGDVSMRTGDSLIIHNCASYHDSNRHCNSAATPRIVNYNSWSMGGCAESDFVSLDPSIIIVERNADGSLPDLSFMKPSEGSTLIDKGINVGLDYKGKSPDLGWKEYEETLAIGSVSNTAVKITHVDDNIIVRCEEPIAQVSVYDLNGLLIAERTGYSKHIVMDVVKSSLYLVRVVLNGKSIGYKIR